jgi:GNAT superfamily N-acetyltransferase
MVSAMIRDGIDLVRTFGGSTRLWASGGVHHVDEDYWVALSGDSNVNFNLACCNSSDSIILAQSCLQPLLDQGKPGIIMLAGLGLCTAELLSASGWVCIGAQPLMLLHPLSPERLTSSDVRTLEIDELSLARRIVTDSFGISGATAMTALPDSIAERGDVTAWGLFEENQLVSSVVIVTEDGLAVIWSMATLPGSQGRGYGRRLLEVALYDHHEKGATGSLLHSSAAGEHLYRGLGYEVIEYLQMWSRPRWVLGLA